MQEEALRPSVLASADKTIMPIHCVRYTQGRSKLMLLRCHI